MIEVVAAPLAQQEVVLDLGPQAVVHRVVEVLRDKLDELDARQVAQSLVNVPERGPTRRATGETNAELIRLDTGHLAVEDSLDEIVEAIVRFDAQRIASPAELDSAAVG